MPEPQFFDIIALVLVGWLTVRGAMRGAMNQITSVAAVVISWIVAAKFSPTLAPMISDEPPWNKVLAMLLLFIGTSFVIWLLHGWISRLLQSIKLKGFDRQMGALLGLTKGLLLCLVLTFFGVTLTERTRSFVLGSQSGKYFALAIGKISAVIPEDVSIILKKNLEGFNDSLHENGKDLKEEKEVDPESPLFSPESAVGSWLESLKSSASVSEKNRPLIDTLRENLGNLREFVKSDSQGNPGNSSSSPSENPRSSLSSWESEEPHYSSPVVPLSGTSDSSPQYPSRSILPFQSTSSTYSSSNSQR